jgi:hypothetical protein
MMTRSTGLSEISLSEAANKRRAGRAGMVMIYVSLGKYGTLAKIIL